MTYIYQWFSFPKVFSVICPKCSGECDCSEIPIIKDSVAFRSGRLTENFPAKLNCQNCGYNKETIVNWKRDAFWKFNVKGKTLWAWNLHHSLAILEYIKSKNRKQLNGSEYSLSFLHMPEFFKLAKNRETVVRKITKAIEINAK